MNIIYFFLVTHHYYKKTSRQRTGHVHAYGSRTKEIQSNKLGVHIQVNLTLPKNS